MTTTAVLDKNENLLWSVLQYHRSCHYFGCLLACKLSISSGEQSEPPSCSQAIILGTTIRDLQISHNAPYLPPKILHNLCFSFLLGITAVPREIENNAYAKFWAANKVYYG